MPTFQYTAKRGPHDVVEGAIDAEDRSGALARLAALGYVPVRVSQQVRAAERAAKPQTAPVVVRPRRVPVAQLTVFTRQFASLIRSSVPLLRGLQILEEQARHPYLRQALREIMEAVRQGETLSVALGKYPLIFPPLYVNLVRSGETSGALDTVLEQLATQAEHDEALRAKVRLAFMYPAFVTMVGIGTITFLMTFVLPRLSRLLTGLGERLPMATRMLMTVASVMSRPWVWAGLVAVVVLAVVLWQRLGVRGRLLVDHLVLRLPMLGPLVQQLEIARFARSFGLQIAQGIPILQATDTAVTVVTHLVIRRELARLPEQLRQGNALSSCLRETSVATPFLVNTVSVGEESGKVSEALIEVATYYERDSERLLQTLATLLEPVLILGMGLIVGFIVMAVLLPIFEMSGINP